MREISETTDRTTGTRPVSVELATLLLATRGLLLITFNWILYLSLLSDPYIIAVVMLPWFFFFGLIDIWSARLLRGRNINGWRYGVIMSVVILLLTLIGLPGIGVLLLSAEGVLFIVIGILSMIEMIVLFIPSVRRYCRT